MVNATERVLEIHQKLYETIPWDLAPALEGFVLEVARQIAQINYEVDVLVPAESEKLKDGALSTMQRQLDTVEKRLRLLDASYGRLLRCARAWRDDVPAGSPGSPAHALQQAIAEVERWL